MTALGWACLRGVRWAFAIRTARSISPSGYTCLGAAWRSRLVASSTARWRQRLSAPDHARCSWTTRWHPCACPLDLRPSSLRMICSGAGRYVSDPVGVVTLTSSISGGVVFMYRPVDACPEAGQCLDTAHAGALTSGFVVGQAPRQGSCRPPPPLGEEPLFRWAFFPLSPPLAGGVASAGRRVRAPSTVRGRAGCGGRWRRRARATLNPVGSLCHLGRARAEEGVDRGIDTVVVVGYVSVLFLCDRDSPPVNRGTPEHPR